MKTGEERMEVFPIDYKQKKSRFDRLHGRKVSTFFPQMVMGGQQKDTRAGTFGIGVFGTSFVVVEISI